VLLVEDDLQIGQSLMRALQDADYSVDWVRDGKERTLDVKVGTMPGEQAQVASADGEPANAAKLGLTLRPSDAGLVVEDADGAAAAAGVRPGDVILALNNQAGKSVEQLRGLLDKASGHVALLVQRGESKMYVPVDVG
jgi:serine protease Do